MKKTTQRAFASFVLLAGMSFWGVAAGGSASAAEEPGAPSVAQPAPDSAVECVKDKDCDPVCGGPGAGVCRWPGFKCLCVM
jgi:hypothetical protein